MALGERLDMESICRVCLRENVQLFLLFDENNAFDGVSILQMLTECTIYKVERNDELPHHICRRCMDNAKDAYSFKKRTEHSYRQLIGLLGKVHQKQLENSVKFAEQSTQTDKLSIHPCEMCDLKFFDPQDLRSHRFYSHKGSSYICKVCGQKYPRLERLRGHLALYHPEEGLTHDTKCNVCGKQFSRRDHMRRHLKNVHGGGISDGKRCNKTALEKPKIHVKKREDSVYFDNSFAKNFNVTNAAVWKGCSIKEIDSDDPNDGIDGFNAHNFISSDHDDDDDDGDDDQLLFVLEEPEINIKREMDSTAFVDDFTSDVNATALTTLDNYARKATYVDRDIKPAFNVAVPTSCQYQSNERSDFKTEPIDDDTNNYSQSSATFPPELILKCEVDNSDDFDKECMSNNEGSLAEEEEILPIQKISPTAGKSNKTQATPNRRNNLLASKDYKCTECDRAFSRRTHVQRHMLTHTLEKPFECPYCLRRFNRNDHLKNHIHNLHVLKQYKCDQCTSTFSHNDALRRHKSLKHSAMESVWKKTHQEKVENCSIGIVTKRCYKTPESHSF